MTITGEKVARKWVLVVHGGAPCSVSLYSPEERIHRREALEAALKAGGQVLAAGGASLDAVQSAVRVLEDAPEFNAGRGAALTSDGQVELDASIMDGRDRRVGAVASLHRIRNPIDLARSVMEKSGHVFLVGEGAEEFAQSQGMAFTDPSYFKTERQWRLLEKAREEESQPRPEPRNMSGTVGAVALDLLGNLAAATSTGGIPNKRYGRVGDSPVIGAGTFADNGVCAVSATGWGEFFIRNAVAHELCARVKYAGESVSGAAKHVIEEVERMGGYGGVIAVDAGGRIATPHSTPSMAHAHLISGMTAVIVCE